MGLNLGAALTLPLIAVLMESAGWQKAIAWSSIPGVLVLALWARATRRGNTPAVSSEELTELGSLAHVTVDARMSPRGLLVRHLLVEFCHLGSLLIITIGIGTGATAARRRRDARMAYDGVR
jgi:hypothetical protein